VMSVDALMLDDMRFSPGSGMLFMDIEREKIGVSELGPVMGSGSSCVGKCRGGRAFGVEDGDDGIAGGGAESERCTGE
jgi:hypothetical protein